MNNQQTLIKNYRDKLLNLHLVTVAIVSFCELLAYLIFLWRGVYTLSFTCSYLWLYVVLPIVLNFGAHIVARKIVKRDTASHEVKNAAVVYATLVTAVLVSVLHREFTVTACAFVFPMILSALFSDRKLLTGSLVVSVLCVVLTLAIRLTEQTLDLDYVITGLALFGFLAVSYLSGSIVIENSELNLFVIENQAMTNTRLRNKIKKDPMTNLYNHKMFFTELEAVIADCETSGKSFCLSMFDIDDFKKINDKHGHDGGDEALLALSKVIRRNCTNSEIPFRYGGEEFAILFKQKTKEEAYAVMEKILREFSSIRFKLIDRPLTFSCGIGVFSPGMTKEEMFDAADDGMYQAKHNGKNQIYMK